MEAQPLPPQDQAVAVAVAYSAHQVADAFVNQYYEILQKTPQEGRNFYKDQSVRSHPCVDGSMKMVTTVRDIDNEIMTSNIREWNPDMDSMHAQESVMGSVILGITGSLTDNDDVSRNFAQTFLLAPQEGGGFYVHNDILLFIEIKKDSEAPPPPPVDEVANPVAVQEADDTANDSSLETAQAAKEDETEKSTSTKEDVETEVKVSESLEGKHPLPTEPTKKSQPSVWSPPKIQDSNKMSYASILAKEGSGPSNTQQSPKAVVKKTETRSSTSPVVAKSSMISNNGPSESNYDVKAIRVKDLPPKMTEESLLEVVKQFGPVKQKNIQIKEYSQDGYRYAFVEFDNPKSAHSAVEARYIRFEDRVSEIQYKKISNQGGQTNMGRPPYGRGGFKSDNFWGREGEGGSSSGSWGNKHMNHDNFDQHSGQARDYNNRRNRYFQDHQ